MIERPYWWDTIAARPAAPRPEISDRRWDTAIVGGGYTGLAAACRLARAGASVVLLERERVGFGASSRNGGQVIAGLPLGPSALVARYGEASARALFDISRDAIAGLERLIADEQIDCDYQRCGHVEAAWKRSHFRAFLEEQTVAGRVFGHEVEVLPRAAQRSELGSDLYHGLLVDAHSRALNPARYVEGLASATCRAGAVIAEGTAVVRIAPAPDGWTLETTAGSVRARDVFGATNGYTDGALPALQRRLVPIGSYIVATEPLTPAVAAEIVPRRRVVFDSKHFLFYFRLTDDNRLLFGGRAEFSTPTPQSAPRAAAVLRAGLVRVFPQLESVRIDYAWGGNVAFTRDRMPHAGRLGGMYYAGGYCGHGIAMATYLGSLLARRIAGEQVEHPLVDDRFPAIPFYRGRPWFLPIAGALYRLKDFLG